MYHNVRPWPLTACSHRPTPMPYAALSAPALMGTHATAHAPRQWMILAPPLITTLFMICMFVNKGQCLRPEWMAKQLEIPSSVDVDAIHEEMGA